MIATRPRVAELVFLHYTRPIHPEFFRIVAARRVCRQGNKLTLWITNIGHVMMLETQHQVLTEVITASHVEMPPIPLGLSHFRGFQAETFNLAFGVHWEFSYQMEVLEPKYFWHLQNEVRAGDLEKGLRFHFGSNGRFPVGAVSYLNPETRRTRIRLRAFHTFPEDYTVVRTDSIVEW